MKRNIVILILCVIIMLIGGCTDTSTNINNTEKDNKVRLNTLQNEVDSYNKIYDAKLKKAIDKYCQYFLSFENRIDTQNVKKLKKYLTSDLYTKLLNQPYNENIEDEQCYYLQSTSVDELFYQEISKKIEYYSTVNEITVLAVCSQSVISDNSTTTFNNIIYKFEMEYRSNQWIISSVENIR